MRVVVFRFDRVILLLLCYEIFVIVLVFLLLLCHNYMNFK